MKLANLLVPDGVSETQIASAMETKIMDALSRSLIKYNTGVSLTPNTHSLAPMVLENAVLLSGCTIPDSCPVPLVVSNSKINMSSGCNICLSDLSQGEIDVYGMDINNPVPTQKLENRQKTKQAMALSFSALKTLWLGNKAYVANDLNSALLLNAYKKDDGIWKKITTSGATNVAITKNAQATEALQMAITGTEARAILDQLIDKQSTTLKMILDSEKMIWVTEKLYDVIVAEDTAQKLPNFTYAEIDSYFGTANALIYRGFVLIKYEHLSAAIRDLKPTTAGTLVLPHRAILTVGLPVVEFSLGVENSFRTKYEETTRKWEAVTDLVIMHPDALQGDFYVTAY